MAVGIGSSFAIHTCCIRQRNLCAGDDCPARILYHSGDLARSRRLRLCGARKKHQTASTNSRDVQGVFICPSSSSNLVWPLFPSRHKPSVTILISCAMARSSETPRCCFPPKSFSTRK